jgi:hypothetical protein
MKIKSMHSRRRAGSPPLARRLLACGLAMMAVAACQGQESPPVATPPAGPGASKSDFEGDHDPDHGERSTESPSLTLEEWRHAVAQRDRLPAAVMGGATAGTDAQETVLAAPPTSSWEYIGPQNTSMGGRVNGIAASSCIAGVRYVATAQGGVWKSTNGGTNWSPLSDKWQSLATSSVAVRSTNCTDTNADVVLVGTGDFDDGEHNKRFAPLGVMRSADGGKTWAQVNGIPAGLATSSILFDPDNPNIALAAQGRGLPSIGANYDAYFGYVWRSTDAGLHWSQMNTDAAGLWSSMSIGVKNGSGVRHTYVAGQQYGGTVLRSDDRGATWMDCDPLPRAYSNNVTAIEVAASRFSQNGVDAPNTVYVLVGPNDGTSGYRVYEHDAACFGGSGWTDIGLTYLGGEAAPAYDAAIAVGGDVTAGDIVYTCAQFGPQAYRSATKGWTSLDMGHPDCHAILTIPTSVTSPTPNGDIVLFGNDGGIYDQAFTGSWLPSAHSENATLGVTQLYSVGTHPGDLTQVIAGAQDNHTFLSSASTSSNLHSWLNTYSGDGGFAAFDRTSPATIYATSNGNFGRNYNGGSGINQLPGLSGAQSFDVGAYAIDPTNPSRIYTATSDGLYFLSPASSATSWQLARSLTLNKPGDFPQAVAVAPSNPSIIYVATNYGDVIRIDQSVGTATVISDNKPDVGFWLFNWISVNPNDASDILVSGRRVGQCDPGYYEFGGIFQPDCLVGGLWRWSNATGASPAWNPVDGRYSGLALPDGSSIGSVARDPDDPANTWYVTTLLGVFQTTDAGYTWSNAGAPHGLPNVSSWGLEINPVTRYMTVGTFGRGIWRIKLAGGKLPDLIVTAQSASHVTGGIKFSATIKNQGTAATPGNVIHSVNFWLDGTLRASASSNTSLGIGASRTLTGTWSTSASVTGSHSLKVVVDYAATSLDNRISESNETNNTRTVTVGL